MANCVLAEKAIAEVRKFGETVIAGSSEDDYTHYR